MTHLIPPPPPSAVASIDAEVYSEGGYLFNPKTKKWGSLVKNKPGIKAIGAYVYATHHSTWVRTLAYNLHDGKGIQLWFPGMDPPEDLWRHVRAGGLLEAHNSMFEYWIWMHVLVKKLGWPPIRIDQMRCTASRAVAHGLPLALGNIHNAITMPVQKQDIGKNLIQEFCVPHNRKKYKYTIGQLHEYCYYDVETEEALSHRVPALSPTEHRIWTMDQRINDRGVYVDIEAARALASRVEKYVEQAGRELSHLTNGAVNSAREVAKIGRWLEGHGLKLKKTPKKSYKLDKEAVEELLLQVDPDSVEAKVLDLRKQFSLAAVDKIKTLCHMVGDDGRLRGLFLYHGAHTGRWTSLGVQLQNLARGKMSAEEVHIILEEVKSGNWSSIEGPRPLEIISNLIRGLFIAAPGHDLLCADFSAIEGRGQAMLAGEQWRIDVFRTHGKIYEQTAADISGIAFEIILQHKIDTGKHHELRALGKVGELASGYSGWINAWLRFGAGKYLDSKDKVKHAILRWRDKSPYIVEMWGGQVRKDRYRWAWKPDLYGIEGTVVKALLQPNTWMQYRDIAFMHNTQHDTLLCRLPSGRCLWYRQPKLTQSFNPWAELPVWEITYMSWSNSGGWAPKSTYGGRLFENIVQAVCRDIMAMAMLRLEDAGYPLVIHVHDEPVAEVRKGEGSAEEMVQLMEQTEDWYRDWPIRVGLADAWRGLRFRK